MAVVTARTSLNTLSQTSDRRANMALVEFFQPTDMSSLTSPIATGGHIIPRVGSYDLYNDSFDSYVSLTGSQFFYPFGSRS